MRFLLCFLLVFFNISFAFAGELLIYTTIEPDLVQAVNKAFSNEHPDIRIKWVRDSTGPISARLIAEKNSPKAQVVFGIAKSAIEDLEREGLFLNYQPSNALYRNYIKQDLDSAWVPVYIMGSALCVNEKELEKKGLSIPTDWSDLTKPEYKDLIVMPSPVSSNIGQMLVRGFISLYGDSGWDYLKSLDANVRLYAHSGCKPCQMAATGEVAIGISASICANQFRKTKAPLKVIFPKSGISWEMEVATILKSTSNLSDAKTFIDFIASPTFSDLVVDYGYIPAYGDSTLPDHLAEMTSNLIEQKDYTQLMRSEILAKWRSLFTR